MNALQSHIEYLNRKKNDLQIDKAFGKDTSEEIESLNQMIANTEKMANMKKALNRNYERGFLNYAEF